MNKSLTALMTKLNWQLNDLNVHIQTNQEQINALEKKLHDIKKQMNQSHFNSLIINPEIEMNRLNFIVQQQAKREELSMSLKNHQELETTLKEKIQRVKTELKMLENYLQREDVNKNNQQKKLQDDSIDEWAIQKRESI